MQIKYIRLPYFGSTCVVMKDVDTLKWSTEKCSNINQFVCERGLIGLYKHIFISFLLFLIFRSLEKKNIFLLYF